MSWIKRNLGFVISGVVGLVLLGLSGWYLYSEMQANDTARDGFDNALKSLRDSQTAATFPSEQNLELARQDLRRATNMAAQAKAIFLPFQRYGNYNDRSFKNYTEDQVDRLQRMAKQFGVTLPADYYFTFGSLRRLMTFDADLIPVWVESMEEIKALVTVLVKARVNSIDSIRRSAISDIEGVDYYMDFMNGVDTVTNRGVIRTPYEVTFSCFSGELAAVLEGFMRSSNCFLLKNIQVNPSEEGISTFVEPSLVLAPVLDAPQIAAPVGPPKVDAATQRRLDDQRFQERYHMKRPGATINLAPPPPVLVVAPVAPRVIPAPVTVLSERPLRVTIFLEILKLDTPPPSSGKKPSRVLRPTPPASTTPPTP